MKKVFTKEVIIGLVTLVSLFILYLGLNYLRGVNLFKPTNHYYVAMPNVSELQQSSPVYIDGFKIGIVSSIDYPFDQPVPQNIVVLISLDESMRVQTGSYFELKTGLTSGSSLHLILNKYVDSYYSIGDTIEGVTNPGMMDKISANLLPQVENLLPRLDSILIGIQTLLNHPALSQSLEHIEATTAHLQKSSKQLNGLLAEDVPTIVKNLKQVSSDFTVVSSNLSEIDMNGTIAKVDKAIENIDQMTLQLNNKDNSLGLLLNDQSLYHNLDSTARNAAVLLRDIKEQPKKYVHFSIF
jgi:phospholipid/cholesterol/gamma-HCH transport system substrate-binding protein